MLPDLKLARRAARLAAPMHPETGDAISFDSGYAFPELFPDLRAAAEPALTRYRYESLQYGRAFGLPSLREWIADYLRDDGARVSTDDVLIVNGAKNGIELMCRLLVDEGDAVVVTAPTYFSAIPILRSFGVTFVEAPQDGEGLDVDALAATLAERSRRGEPLPKFVYNVPDFHNPTGVTMSRARREALIELSATLRIPILEDSPYRKLRYEGAPEPSLKSLDRDELVFSIGTFSKLLAPGLRIGWIAGRRDMLARLARLKSDGGACPLTQRIVFEFFASGGLEPHLVRARAAYASHRDAMASALRQYLPEAAFTVPAGGYYLWLELDAGIDSAELAERAHATGVSVIAGEAFYAADDTGSAKRRGVPRRFLRLAYSYSDEDAIERGVKRLAAAYRSLS